MLAGSKNVLTVKTAGREKEKQEVAVRGKDQQKKRRGKRDRLNSRGGSLVLMEGRENKAEPLDTRKKEKSASPKRKKMCLKEKEKVLALVQRNTGWEKSALKKGETEEKLRSN